MISLRKSIAQIEHYANRFQAAVSCYASAIATLEKRLCTRDARLDASRRDRLRRLRERLAGEPPQEVLFEVAQALDSELECYQQAMTGALADNQAEMRDVVEVLGGLMARLAEQSGKDSSRLQNLSQQLEVVARLDTMAEVRCGLRTHIADLNAYVADTERESQQVIARLQDQVKYIEQRLATVEEMAATDPLTGVANRRECERLLAGRIHSGKSFSILLFDLDRFKKINDQYGHKWGDNVLITFARRLKEQLRAGDRLVRWGGDEFLVIFDCGLEEAQRRGLEMAEKAGGQYDVGFNGRALRVEVRLSCGVAEYSPGETVEQVIARVDACMYENKRHKLESRAPGVAGGQLSWANSDGAVP